MLRQLALSLFRVGNQYELSARCYLTVVQGLEAQLEHENPGRPPLSLELATAYNNLATSYVFLGRNREAAAYAELSSKMMSFFVP